MRFDFGSSDEDFNVKQFDFGSKIDNDRMSFMNSSHKLSVNYRYLDLSITEYKFIGNEFDILEIEKYFTVMKHICSSTFDSLRNSQTANDGSRLHFFPSRYSQCRKLRMAVEKLLGKKCTNAENTPEFYHFALYTDTNGNADRNTGVKSPRIHFFVGDDATIYPLFFDPYHEINK